jgi:hypothetical protein
MNNTSTPARSPKLLRKSYSRLRIASERNQVLSKSVWGRITMSMQNVLAYENGTDTRNVEVSHAGLNLNLSLSLHFSLFVQ